jgi:hypothetical protein
MCQVRISAGTPSTPKIVAPFLQTNFEKARPPLTGQRWLLSAFFDLFGMYWGAGVDRVLVGKPQGETTYKTDSVG